MHIEWSCDIFSLAGWQLAHGAFYALVPTRD